MRGVFPIVARVRKDSRRWVRVAKVTTPNCGLRMTALLVGTLTAFGHHTTRVGRNSATGWIACTLHVLRSAATGMSIRVLLRAVGRPQGSPDLRMACRWYEDASNGLNGITVDTLWQTAANKHFIPLVSSPSSPLNMAPRCTTTTSVDSSSPLHPLSNHSPARSLVCRNRHRRQVSALERRSQVLLRSRTQVIDR